MPKAATLALLLPLALSAQVTTTLSPKTTAAFVAYLKTAEPQMTGKPRYPELQANELRVEPVKADGSFEVDGGLIHDWAAGLLVPNATPEQALAVLQNYAAYKSMYPPEIVDSRVLSHSGDRWRVYLKIIKKKVFTAVLNSEYDVVYKPLGQGRWQMTSRSTRIVELDGERELPAGTGHGFLWRLNAYWLIEPRPNGVYLECRTISLSRDIPFGLGWAVGPFVRTLPPESLHLTMDATASAMRIPSGR